MSFSKRTDWNLAENDLAVAVRARRQAGLDILDLTVSNPTVCGFAYEQQEILASLSDPEAMTYVADPLGLVSARQGVAQYCRDAGAAVDVERICLTTSTSEAYSYLFRLLCDPGDEVLVARPSYPLFDYIAQLDNVVLREYPLSYDPNADEHCGWSIDLEALEQAITSRTRAMIVVHPNNPTGNFVHEAERRALDILCEEKGIALIVDEVFLDYSFGHSEPSFAVGQAGCLTFVLSGISKVCGLPQMKASWIAVLGPAALTRSAMQRLEVIADTFLSMNAPVQLALPGWLGGRRSIQKQIMERVTTNRLTLDARLGGTSAQRLELQAGWTAVLRVPRTVGGSDFAAAALACGVLVQPGMFYGLPEGRAVVSLLTPPETWLRGLTLLPIET